jgi:hypothetical protein
LGSSDKLIVADPDRDVLANLDRLRRARHVFGEIVAMTKSR